MRSALLRSRFENYLPNAAPAAAVINTYLDQILAAHALEPKRLALIGFSWALATPNAQNSDGNPPKLPAVVGHGLTFSNPFLLPGQDAQFPAGGARSSTSAR